MLPNLYWPTINLGPLTLQVWGLCVAAGMGTALYVAQRRAKQRGLNHEAVLDAGFWVILASLIGSRIFFVVTEWAQFSGPDHSWIDAFKFWQGGMSINGGFIGAAIAGVIYFRYKKLPFWNYADVIISALPLGVGIGRLGCAFIFDHPGTVTNFVLGEVYYLDGLVHHNHGLYLALDGLILGIIFTWCYKKYKAAPPFFAITYLVWEGIVRLILDHDRVLDSTWLSLTAAQWMGLVMILAGLVLFGQRQNIRKLMVKK